MKGKDWLVAVFVLAIAALGGCGRSETTATHDVPLEPIKVVLEVMPTTVPSGSPVTFTAKVTHQGENVDDAQEVMFEFWNIADETAEHSKVKVKSAGDGTYVLEHKFDEPGTYEVISHVTARDQHSMPSKPFTVE
ncbi:FixH family protein [Paenibacillus macerans]|uniref:FixH family protein n=1 Tax=Paenibacillus macerans TaxID=44252 RepID=UPI003D315B0E